MGVNKTTKHAAALIALTAALGCAFQLGLGLTSKVTPTVHVYEVKAVGAIDAGNTQGTAMPSRYQY
ncbi:hypothetical protein KZO85_00135 [Chromohalobacter canadensis]|uniref:hypothetical protein n=1 Tax=Chromohalobacter canadensis TaxID=141389 RepID=UPI0021C1FBCC|nr:hypothetical protein [Chromohalobacter canadensis]MCT8466984.1 hypothetical protein [Chromohalobacter canadensis]